MDKEKIEEYSKKYKSVQKKLSVVVMIFIILVGLVFLAGGIYFCFNENKILKFVGIVMIVAGVLNVALGIKFNSFSQKNLKELPEKEAAKRYCKITGKE